MTRRLAALPLSPPRLLGALMAVVAALSADGEAPFDRWQTTKGLTVAIVLLLAFLFTSWPREHVALTAAGVLLMSRQLHSSRMLGLVDWELLVLFIGLFVVNHALTKTGVPERLVADPNAAGVDLRHPAPLFVAMWLRLRFGA